MSQSHRCCATSRGMSAVLSLLIFALLILPQQPVEAAADGLPTFAGPAMGTTYRVTLAAPVPGLSLGQVHREIDRLLAQLDAGLNTWRSDSDASRFNRAVTTDWLEVSPELADVVSIAQRLHSQTAGRFDITVGPLIDWHRKHPAANAQDVATTRAPPAKILAHVGSPMLHVRTATASNPAALRKDHPKLTIDLGGIGPGYAVDSIGDRLTALGSASHLVELGGEVRGWGTLEDGHPWQVGIASGPEGSAVSQQISLNSGEAVAVVEHVPTRPIINPRTGQHPGSGPPAKRIIRATTCAEADALATASLIPHNRH